MRSNPNSLKDYLEHPDIMGAIGELSQSEADAEVISIDSGRSTGGDELTPFEFVGVIDSRAEGYFSRRKPQYEAADQVLETVQLRRDRDLEHVVTPPVRKSLVNFILKKS